MRHWHDGSGRGLRRRNVYDLPVSGICIGDTQWLGRKMGLGGDSFDRETRRQRPAPSENAQSVNLRGKGGGTVLRVGLGGGVSTAPGKERV